MKTNKLQCYALCLLGLTSNHLLYAQEMEQNTVLDSPPEQAIPAQPSDIPPSNVESPSEVSPTSTMISSDKVTRAIFTTAIVNKEPTDFVVTIPKDQGKIYFFTELSGLQGETITHIWEYNNLVMAEVNIEVKSPHYRAYSVKNISPAWVGNWKVTVSDSSGNILNQSNFEVTE